MVSSVITGATRLMQTEDNLAAAEEESLLTGDVLEQTVDLLGDHPVG